MQGSENISKAFSGDNFRQLGHELVDMLADYLDSCRSKDNMPVVPWKEPEQAFDAWAITPPDSEASKVLDFFSRVLKESVHIHHPHYVGHQVSAPVPITSLAAMMVDLLNNGMGVYEVGTVSVPMEKRIISYLAQITGMSETTDGFLTAGGSLGNLTALLAARQIKAGYDVWQEGTKVGKPMAVMVSEEAHYCVDRAIKIMGWGEEGIIRVPVNDKRQMRTELLSSKLEEANAKGIKVIAAIGSACSTATGSYDDLEAIADFCEANDLWFHVDGAHGAAVIFSEKYKHLVKGIDRADSWIMDFHKMLLTPALCTAMVFRDGRHSYQTFAQKASYLFEQADPEWYNLAKRTFECTKFGMAIKVFSILQTYGKKLWEEFLDQMHDLSRDFSTMIQKSDSFELALMPESNIICFRFNDSKLSLEENNDLNSGIREKIIQSGQYYLVKTKLKEVIYLRTTLINPHTNTDILSNLLELIEKEARILVKEKLSHI